MEKKPLSHFTCAIIIAAILIIYSLLVNFLGLYANKALSYVSLVVLCGGIIIGINMYGKSVNNSASFGGLFAFGFKTTAVITLIIIAFDILFFTIFPDMKEKIMDATRQSMIQQGNLSEEQIDQFMTGMAKFFWVGLIGFALFSFLVVGAISSLIGAAITKKTPQTPFQPQA